MILLFDKKVTANQLAKYLVFCNGENAEYWHEISLVNLKAMSEKEKQELDIAISKQLRRVYKFLNLNNQ